MGRVARLSKYLGYTYQKKKYLFFIKNSNLTEHPVFLLASLTLDLSSLTTATQNSMGTISHNSFPVLRDGPFGSLAFWYLRHSCDKNLHCSLSPRPQPQLVCRSGHDSPSVTAYDCLRFLAYGCHLRFFFSLLLASLDMTPYLNSVPGVLNKHLSHPTWLAS